MEAYSLILWIVSFVFETVLVLRAKRKGLFSHFPLFYSYLVYIFVGSAFTFLIYSLRPQFYPTAYWFYFLISILVEFAVLLEISDHIFERYQAIRLLGRLITLSVSAVFLFVYVLPGFFEQRPSSAAVLVFSRRATLTKAAILVALVAAARHYRLPLSRNVAGLLLGFALYLGVNVANFAAALQFGKAFYVDVLRFVSPIAYTLCLLVWTIALWELQPAAQTARKHSGHSEEISKALGYQLERVNTWLSDLLRK